MIIIGGLTNFSRTLKNPFQQIITDFLAMRRVAGKCIAKIIVTFGWMVPV